MIRAEVFSYLPEAAKEIRQRVFIQEQGFQEEYDSIDEIATHLLLYRGEIPMATCRIFPGKEKGVYIMGRLAVYREFRGAGIGSRMLCEAEACVRELGGTCLILHSQLRAKEFYEKSGYTAYGAVEYEEDCPHIWMKKEV